LQNYEELSDFSQNILIHWCSRPAKQAGQNAILKSVCDISDGEAQGGSFLPTPGGKL